MKKRVISGVIVIIIAIGGTIAMNTVGIFKGSPYKSTTSNSQYVFYGNTYEYRWFRNDNSLGITSGLYEKDGKNIEFMEFGLTQIGEINAFEYKQKNDRTGYIKYINKTAIWTQIGLVVVLIFGVIEIVIARISEKKQN